MTLRKALRRCGNKGSIRRRGTTVNLGVGDDWDYLFPFEDVLARDWEIVTEPDDGVGSSDEVTEAPIITSKNGGAETAILALDKLVVAAESRLTTLERENARLRERVSELERTEAVVSASPRLAALENAHLVLGQRVTALEVRTQPYRPSPKQPPGEISALLHEGVRRAVEEAQRFVGDPRKGVSAGAPLEFRPPTPEEEAVHAGRIDQGKCSHPNFANGRCTFCGTPKPGPA